MRIKLALLILLLGSMAFGSCKLRRKNRCTTCPTWSYVPASSDKTINS